MNLIRYFFANFHKRKSVDSQANSLVNAPTHKQFKNGDFIPLTSTISICPYYFLKLIEDKKKERNNNNNNSLFLCMYAYT